MFILLGDDKTGKTGFQKKVITDMCGVRSPKRLAVNTIHKINNQHVSRKFETLFTANRSFQELRRKYGSLDEYFDEHFRDADIVILSSHITERGATLTAEVQDMIHHGHGRLYNVCGVFFENSVDIDEVSNSELGRLNWDERWYAANPHSDDEAAIERQIQAAAREFVYMIAQRSHLA
jgi:hypothetical protein